MSGSREACREGLVVSKDLFDAARRQCNIQPITANAAASGQTHANHAYFLCDPPSGWGARQTRLQT